MQGNEFNITLYQGEAAQLVFAPDQAWLVSDARMSIAPDPGATAYVTLSVVGGQITITNNYLPIITVSIPAGLTLNYTWRVAVYTLVLTLNSDTNQNVELARGTITLIPAVTTPTS